MSNNPDFTLQSHVDYLYQHRPRRLAFNAGTLEEFKVWQTAFRAEVVKLLGLAGRTPPLTPQAEKLHSIDRGDYVEEKYALERAEWEKAAAAAQAEGKRPPAEPKHNPPRAPQSPHKISCLYNGRIVPIGPPATLYSRLSTLY